MAQRKRIWLVSVRMWIRSPASLGGLRTQRCCELWCRRAAAAPVRPLAWEPPCATGAALKKKKINAHVRGLESVGAGRQIVVLNRKVKVGSWRRWGLSGRGKAREEPHCASRPGTCRGFFFKLELPEDLTRGTGVPLYRFISERSWTFTSSLNLDCFTYEMASVIPTIHPLV